MALAPSSPHKIKEGQPLLIDLVLAKHYGFTDEELDFIINYDIKYRLDIGQGGAPRRNSLCWA